MVKELEQVNNHDPEHNRLFKNNAKLAVNRERRLEKKEKPKYKK